MEPRSRETTPTKEDLEFIVDDGYRHDEDPDYVPNEKFILKGPEFKRLTRNAKKLGAETLDYSTRKNNKYMATLPGGKKVHFGSPKYPDYTIHKDKERRDKYLSRATKIKNKQGDYENITQENIIFNEAKEYKVKDSKIKYKRIPIEVKYPNGKKGPLVVESPVLFSFGVNEKKNQETGKLVGYSIPVCLWAKDSEPNNKEKAFFDVINNVTTLSQQHLENEYEPDLASSLSSPFYYKQEEYMDKITSSLCKTYLL
ncbi:unnamed protein product [Porites lobata]|uniref:Uncharacterized protein n=1 Tax=Porites lobata TaxID=104759 RepID=A0ABN8QKU8_9CNID|nr:unnamed protein product [Porites lobata]